MKKKIFSIIVILSLIIFPFLGKSNVNQKDIINDNINDKYQIVEEKNLYYSSPTKSEEEFDDEDGFTKGANFNNEFVNNNRNDLAKPLIAQAIYSEDDDSLTFIIAEELVTVGEKYNDKTITAVYTGFETSTYTSREEVPWYADDLSQTIKSVTFENEINPVSTAFWFYNFKNCQSYDLEKLNTSKTKTMEAMFTNNQNLESLDLTSFDVSNVKSFASMFYYCLNLKTIKGLNTWDTGNVESLYYTFKHCRSLVNFNVENWDVSKVTDMEDLFCDCHSIEKLNLSKWKTESLTNLQGTFTSIQKATLLDLTGWDTSKVTNMLQTFWNCENLTEIKGLSELDTSNVTEMRGLFGYFARSASEPAKIDISKWDTGNVTVMYNMFFGSNIAELDLSRLDTSNVTTMKYMFRNTQAKTINISNWDVSNVTTFYGMFYGATNLETIYANETFENTIQSSAEKGYIFGLNNNLIGGNGTKFSDNSYKYARIDSNETPGYFTNIDDEEIPL